MKISYLWEFCALVSTKNMTITARNLNVSQQSLSKHLAALEKELGTQLFERHRGSQSLKLTPQGEHFSHQAIEMLNLWNRAKIDMSHQSKYQKRLRINSSHREPFLDLITRYQRQAVDNPDYAPLYWTQSSPLDSITLLRQGETDIALDPFSVNMQEAQELEHVHLFYDDAVLMIHVNDPLSKHKLLSIEDLRGLRLLCPLHGKGTIYGWIPHDLCNPKGFSPKLESLPYDSEEALFAEHLNPGHYALVTRSSINHLQSFLPFACFAEIKDAVFDMHAFWDSKNTNRQIPETIQELVRLSQNK